jgi:outer membrane autotransporter protein
MKSPFRKTLVAQAVALGCTLMVSPVAALAQGTCNLGANSISTVASGTCTVGENSSLTVTSSGVINGVVGGGVQRAVVASGGTSTPSLFVANSGTVNGDISILGTMSGGITNNAGGSINGPIKVIGPDRGGNGSMAGSVTNNGLIGGGISNSGTIGGSITNSGTINAGILNGATVGGTISNGIINSGTINGGITNSDGSVSGTISNGIVNSGTINGGITNGVSGSSISGTINGGITNTGTINGTIRLAGSTLNLNGTSGAVNGQIFGGKGTVNVNGTYTRSAGNEINVANFNVNSGGVLNFAANESLTANTIQVAGTLGVVAGATATFNGPTSITGTFRTGATSSSNYGKLLVNGAATLPSVAKIDVDVNSVNSLASGQKLGAVIRATSLTGGDSFSVTDNSALFKFTGIKNGNDVDLLIESERTVLQSVNAMGNTPATGAATVLDTIVLGQVPVSSDMQNVVTALGRLTTQQQVSDAATQTLPLLAGNGLVAMQSSISGTNRIVQARQENLRGVSSGDDFAGDKRMWFKAYGSQADQNDRKGVSGFDANIFGGVIGADAELSASDRVGLAFAYGKAKVDSNSTVAPSNSKVDSYQLVVYGSHALSDKTEIHYQGDIGRHDTKGQREILFMGRVASANYDSRSAHFGMGLSHTISINERSSISPFVRADYTWMRDDGYTETGADSLNLKVDSHTTKQMIYMAGSKFLHQYNDKLAVLGNLGVGYDALAKEGSLTAAYVGGGAAFSTPGLDPSPWLVQAGLGVVTTLKAGMDLSIRYDFEGREDFKNQTASAKLRWMF